MAIKEQIKNYLEECVVRYERARGCDPLIMMEAVHCFEEATELALEIDMERSEFDDMIRALLICSDEMKDVNKAYCVEVFITDLYHPVGY